MATDDEKRAALLSNPTRLFNNTLYVTQGEYRAILEEDDRRSVDMWKPLFGSMSDIAEIEVVVVREGEPVAVSKDLTLFVTDGKMWAMNPLKIRLPDFDPLSLFSDTPPDNPLGRYY